MKRISDVLLEDFKSGRLEKKIKKHKLSDDKGKLLFIIGWIQSIERG